MTMGILKQKSIPMQGFFGGFSPTASESVPRVARPPERIFCVSIAELRRDLVPEKSAFLWRRARSWRPAAAKCFADFQQNSLQILPEFC